VLVLLIAALVAVPRVPRSGPAAEQPVQQQLSDTELRERVDGYLNALDRPVSSADWKALGPQAAPLLEAVIADETALPSRRAKAVNGLVAAAPDRASRLVGTIAKDEQQPVVVRVAAMHGAGRVLPSSRAVRELGPVLRSAKSAGMRAEAANVLARKQGGCADVRDQVARENSEHRPAFSRAMKRCGD